MNEINTRSQQQPSTQTGTRRDGRGSDGDDFAHSLQRLESPPAALNAETPAGAEPAMTAKPEWLDAPNAVTDEYAMTNEDTVADKKDGANPAVGGAGAPVSLPAESAPSHDGSWTEPAAVSVLQPLLPPGLAAVESLPNASPAMSLQDFSALLGRAGLPTSGEQVWRFTLPDPASSISQIALTGAAAGGRWSVALTAQGSEQQALTQHIQRLRTRLENLEQGVTQVTITREETP